MIRMNGPIENLHVALPETWPVAAASADIEINDFVKLVGGYATKCGAGDVPDAVAISAAASPSSNGGTNVRVDASPLSRFAYPPDAGTVTDALRGTAVDLGGAQSIDIDASVDKAVIVQDVDIAANRLIVRLNKTY